MLICMSFVQALRELPESVGFDVEVKYPVPNTVSGVIE